MLGIWAKLKDRELETFLGDSSNIVSHVQRSMQRSLHIR